MKTNIIKLYRYIETNEQGPGPKYYEKHMMKFPGQSEYVFTFPAYEMCGRDAVEMTIWALLWYVLKYSAKKINYNILFILFRCGFIQNYNSFRVMSIFDFTPFFWRHIKHNRDVTNVNNELKNEKKWKSISEDLICYFLTFVFCFSAGTIFCLSIYFWIAVLRLV
jgi:hypothetical protein